MEKIFNNNSSLIYAAIIIFCIILYFLFCYDGQPSIPSGYDNFDNNNDVNIYYFNTSWCIWSKRFSPTWEKFVDLCSKNYPNIITHNIDGDDNKSKCEEYQIKGFPTIIFEKNNKRETYNGQNDINELITYLEKFIK